MNFDKDKDKDKDNENLKDIQIEDLKSELFRLRDFIIQNEEVNQNKSAVTISHLPIEEKQRPISNILESDTDINIQIEPADNELNSIKLNSIKSNSIKSNSIKSNSIKSKISGASSNESDIINGWDDDANSTLKNWYYVFEELSHSYQYILDRNYKISSNLSMISVISSSILSIFSGFKLWVQDDKVFQSTSDIIMMVSNFAIAGITTMAKRYIDDNRNEKIRIYIEEVDKFMNLVYAQYCTKPFLRTVAKDFFKDNNETYTRLIISAPNLSINELQLARLHYKTYKKSFHYNL